MGIRTIFANMATMITKKAKKEKDPLWWMVECPKAGESCMCQNECMYLRQKTTGSRLR